VDDKLGVEGDEGGRGIRGVHRDAAPRLEDRVLAVHRRRRIGVADVAAGAVAGPAAPVVPAAGVLGEVSPERALVPDLGRRHFRSGFAQDRVLRADRLVRRDLGEGSEGADLDAVTALSDTLHLGDPAEVDDDLGPLDAVLEPVQAIEASSVRPGDLAVPAPERQGVFEARRLEELEGFYRVVNHGHRHFSLSGFDAYTWVARTL
jgi:hypothetical protein